MKTLDQLLRSLERPDVAELALVSDRLPCVRIGSSFDPIDDEAPSADTILAMLVSVGGSRYVEMLGPTPKVWSSRLEGVGTLSISALQRDEEVQARFSIVKRDDKGKARKASLKPTPAEKSLRPGRPSRGPRRQSRPASRSAAKRPTLDEFVLDSASLPPPARPSSAEPPGDLAAAQRRLAPTEPSMRMGPRPGDDHAPVHPRPRILGLPRSDRPAPRSERPAPRSDRPAAKSDHPPKSERPRARPAPPLSMDAPPSVGELKPLVRAAREAGASDLHLIAGRPALLRVAGELRSLGGALEPDAVERMLLATIPPRLVDQLAEEGSCDFALDHESHGRFRVNVSRQLTGYKGSLRLIPREVPTLESLGMPAAIASITKHHQGLVLFTGPTGHGKSCTMAAVVDLLNREKSLHIITVEDPVEILHPRKKALLSQREVGTHTNSFATALKAALREDPDVIVVGELRDPETVRMAVSASETGHLVLGTMNTPSAAKTIDRVIDLFPPADQAQARVTLASGLRLIVSQRLVPSADKTRHYAAAELLPGSVPLSALIREGKTFQIPSLQQRSKALGIVRLDESLADLVKDLRVTLEVAKTFAEVPSEIEVLAAGRKAGPGQTPGAVSRRSF